MTPARIITDERLAQLEQARGERKDKAHLPRTMTRADVGAYVEHTALIDRRIAALRRATAALAALPDNESDSQWLDHVTTWRKALCDELQAMPPRLRDVTEMGTQQNLALSIRVIDFGLGVITDTGYDLTTLRLGQLMREAGYELTDAHAITPYVQVVLA